MPNNYNVCYQKYVNRFEEQLKIALLKLENVPEQLKNAMSYAVCDGGKRVRPVLCYATADMLGVDLEKIDTFAVAIELIHSYSLVHDDLPCMDNDDYRRGKLSTHKKFGEAFGVLAGDGLLNFAFEYPLNKQDFSPSDAKALKFLSYCSGALGMIGGQALDLLNEKCDNISQEVLYEIYINKTSKLLLAPIIIASIFADKKHYDRLIEYGINLGIMFQISDDLLDAKGDKTKIGKTPGKDLVQDKLTSIKTFGLDGAINQLKIHYDKCLSAIKDLDNNEFLLEFTKKLFERTK